MDLSVNVVVASGQGEGGRGGGGGEMESIYDRFKQRIPPLEKKESRV